MKQYESYESTGDDRIGMIPAQWVARKLKNVTSFAYGDSLKDEDRYQDGNVPVFGSNGKVGNHFSANTKAPVIIIGRKGSYGKITYSNKPSFAIDTTFFVDETVTRSNIRWLYYALEVLDLDGFTQDSAVPGLSRAFAYSKLVPVPSDTEQQTIADYLDKETTRIDQLIANKRQQIEKLNELRQITISRAVTQGLNPDAPMKDSGVEWLGEIPQSWFVRRMKYIVELNPSKSEVSDIPDTTQVSFLPMENVESDGSIKLTDVKPIFEIRNGYTYCCDNDVIFAKITPCFENGKGALCKGLTNKIAFGSTEFIVLRPKSFVDPLYIYYITKINAFMKLGESRMTGSAGQKRVPEVFVSNFKVPLPDKEIQIEIANYLDKEITRFIELQANTEMQIERLEELRKITIHNAVTGKIKVTE